jgi:hypothetical protein
MLVQGLADRQEQEMRLPSALPFLRQPPYRTAVFTATGLVEIRSPKMRSNTTR